MPSIISKIVRALSDLPATLRTTPESRLVMTLLVKNEEQMLAQNLEFHHRMGVDAFIVTDNGSTDRTPQIIEEYRRRGWIRVAISEPAGGYEQKRWVDRMVWIAKTQLHADWIINADADEMWHHPSGNLKTPLSQTRANVLSCPVLNVLPDESRPWTEWTETVRPVSHPEEFDLSPYSIYTGQTVKVAHRAAGYLQISMGNHKVKMLPRRVCHSEITVYHYNLRSRDQFLAKMINGGRQLEQHSSRHGGRHWRYFYALHKQDPALLIAEYDRVVGTASLARLRAEGFVVKDCPVPRVLETEGNNECLGRKDNWRRA